MKVPKELDDPQLFDDPKPFDDPQLFDDQLEVWTLIIQKSTVIPPSLMVVFVNIVQLNCTPDLTPCHIKMVTKQIMLQPFY